MGDGVDPVRASGRLPSRRLLAGWGVGGILGVLVTTAWGPMVRGGLVSDDWVWLERARTGQVLEPGLFFRPACWCTFWAQRARSPGLLHGTDLLLHWVAAWQVVRLVRALGGSALTALAPAAVFATLPSLHEAICWSSARCGVAAVDSTLAAFVSVFERHTAATVVLVALALTLQESAVGLLSGLPLLLLACGRRREVVRWSLLLAGVGALYLLFLRLTGSHARLSGGYVAPFRLDWTLHHLGAYLGLAAGLEGTSGWWPLWGLVGAGTLLSGHSRRWLLSAVWAWATLAMVPLVKLGGPEQPRFLYVMAVPVVVGLGVALSTVGHRKVRLGVATVLLAGAVAMVPGARRACADWIEAGSVALEVAARAAEAFPSDRPAIAVHPPEWVRRAHLYRNGLFSALRLTTGLPYRGLSIPPSLGLTTCGDLVAWLKAHAPTFLSDERVGAWLFVEGEPVALKGWRDPAASTLPLEQARRGKGD